MSADHSIHTVENLSTELNTEEWRHIRESLNEGELAVFGIITRPRPELDRKEIEAIEKVCRDLLAKLKTEKPVFDWRKCRTTICVSVEKMLDLGLLEKQTAEIFEQKCVA